MAKKGVADLLVDVQAEAGVRRIFGVPGDRSTASPTRFEHSENWIGAICAMKKRQHLPREQKPISPVFNANFVESRRVI